MKSTIFSTDSFFFLIIRYIRIKEVGILSKHRRIWDAPQPPCLSNSFIFSVGWEYTAPIFLFMAMANVVSLFILICEKVVFACENGRTVKNRNRLSPVK